VLQQTETYRRYGPGENPNKSASNKPFLLPVRRQSGRYLGVSRACPFLPSKRPVRIREIGVRLAGGLELPVCTLEAYY
jgi:hypothetical protein